MLAIIACLTWSIMVPRLCFADESLQDDRLSKNPTQEEVKKAMDKIPPVTVYGKVIDQNNDPVADVAVEVTWKVPKLGAGWASHVKTDRIQTDGNGLFKWTIVKGFDPSILRLERAGYEFIMEISSPYFCSNPDGSQMIYTTSKDSPLLLYLRRKGETTFLLKRDTMRLDLKLGGDVARFADILPGPDQAELDMRAAGKMQGNRQIGFGVKVDYSTNDVVYWLTFVAPEGGALLLSDKILYEAPEQGYQTNVTVAISARGNENRLFLVKKPMWLFIKTAEPTVYARLDVDFDAVTPSIRFKSAINPYGDRNFEEETDLDYNGRQQMETKARISLRLNKRAEKPVLQNAPSGAGLETR